MSMLLSWLGTYLIHSTLLLGGAWLVTRRLRGRESLSDLIWKCAFVGSVITPLLVAAGAVQPVSAPVVMSDVLARPALLPSAPEPEVATLELSATSSPSAPRTFPIRETEVESTVTTKPARHVSPATFVVFAWASIATLLLLRHALRRRALLMALADRHVVVSGEVSELFRDLCRTASLRRPVRLTSARACPVPIALTSSEVCVPERFLAELDVEQQRGALAHEIGHLMRRDPVWLHVHAAITGVFFFQPLNFVARRELREAAEWLCDDWAARAGSGLGLARCLADVASWLHPSPRKLLSATIPMAENPSTLLRRVERLLHSRTSGTPRGRVLTVAAAIVIMIAIAGVAPAVSSTRMPVVSGSTSPATVLQSMLGSVLQGEIVRAPNPRAPLAERWSWAHAQARTNGSRDYWIVYSFARPLEGNEQYMSDSEGINFPDVTRGTPVGQQLGNDPAYGNGTIALMFHFRANGDGGIDRVSQRSMNAAMDFGRGRVYWLGIGADAESVPFLDGLMTRTGNVKMEGEVVDALAMHATSSLVVPVLSRILDGHPTVLIRAEAAEGLEWHSTPAALQRAHQAAVSDRSSEVRAEAAEAIGSMRVAGAVDVLVELATTSPDNAVRSEAAEALGEQPAQDALRGIERVVFEARYEDARLEAVEALGDLNSASSLPLLRRIIATHPSSTTRVEAVETLADLEGVDVLPLVREILEQSDDIEVREEALDVLTDLGTDASFDVLVEVMQTSTSAVIRREAMEAIVDFDERKFTAQLASVVERRAFDDPDFGTQMEAVDALADLPRGVGRAALGRIAESHPNREIREEARDHLSSSARK